MIENGLAAQTAAKSADAAESATEHYHGRAAVGDLNNQSGGVAYEVEFVTLEGNTAAVVTVEARQVRPVRNREITHARELQAA